jgi:hypothetical protein
MRRHTILRQALRFKAHPEKEERTLTSKRKHYESSYGRTIIERMKDRGAMNASEAGILIKYVEARFHCEG